MTETAGRLDRGDGVELAWKHRAGRGPTIVFLPGFRSDMEGSKAVRLAAFAEARGFAMLRLDYSGHGASGGRFEDGTIGQWTQDALTVIGGVTSGPLLLVGSSMGGWIGVNVALALPERLTGFIGIAAAPDFTETLIWGVMARHERTQLLTEGAILLPSDYGDPVPISRALIEEGRNHLRLAGPIAIHCPVWLLQGQQDAEVPWRTALTLAERIASPTTRVTLIKDGDHRLSRESDLQLLEDVVLHAASV